MRGGINTRGREGMDAMPKGRTRKGEEMLLSRIVDGLHVWVVDDRPWDAQKLLITNGEWEWELMLNMFRQHAQA